ncbi:MAG: ribose-5-phosphate isomerase RpiA [Candidatus Dormibacteria bacterium]
MKRLAAEKAVEQISDGMLLGLGTGSTAREFIDVLGIRVAAGLRVTCIATSIASERQAEALGIPIVDRADRPLDLTVDGADEIDPGLNLIKGLGGALVREKVVAAASRRMLVIATEEKLVPNLGHRCKLPVEVLPLLWERTAATIELLGLTATLRPHPGNEDPSVQSPAYVTDNGNFIVDCRLKGLMDPQQLSADLDAIPGVIGHGLFVRLASQAVIAGPHGVRLVDGV